MTAPYPAVQQPSVGVVSADQFNTYVQTVVNFAQLRTFTGLDNMVVSVQGASSPNDGGQGSFYYSSSAVATDNNSTIIVPNGQIQGAWLRLPSVLLGIGSQTNNAISATAMIPTTSGLPSGVPSFTATGYAPFVIDATNSKIWFYIGGTWKGVTVS